MKQVIRTGSRAHAAGQRSPANWTESPRYPFSLRADIYEPSTGKQLIGWTSDISRGGCYVLTVDTLATGTLVQLRLDRANDPLQTLACVGRSTPGRGMALAFVNKQPDQIKLLEQWLSRVIEK